ncbi:MAG TPA: FixH family protein [Pyrinomonadaceae bacterium]|jgi:hypothetical protein|nr:FixH family protein [Pyrinomonadaceae bacterium]
MGRQDRRGAARVIPTAGFRRAALSFACAAALLAGACQRSAEPASSVVVSYDISPQPPRVGPATISISLSDAAKPVSGARVTLEGDMTHAGMSPVFAEAKEVEPGRYSAPLDFTMGGDWVVLMHAALSDGRKLERQLDVKGVRAE